MLMLATQLSTTILFNSLEVMVKCWTYRTQWLSCLCFKRWPNDKVFNHLNAILSSHTCTCKIIHSAEAKVCVLWFTHVQDDEDDHLQLKWNTMHVSKHIIVHTHAHHEMEHLSKKSDPFKASTNTL